MQIFNPPNRSLKTTDAVRMFELYFERLDRLERCALKRFHQFIARFNRRMGY